MEKILCLDFDGVICNSIQECLYTSYLAYGNYKNKLKIDYKIRAQIPIDIIEKFNENRYLVKPAKDYGLLQEMLHKKQLISPDNFYKFKKEKIFSENTFERIFFKTRNNLIQSNRMNWFGMHKIYESVKIHWLSLTQKYPTYIVTNKDYNSVSILLDHFNLSIDKSKILGKEIEKPKYKILSNLATKYALENKNVIFIDDSSDYVNEMLGFGFSAFFAKWGYEKNVNNNISKNNTLNNFAELNNKL